MPPARSVLLLAAALAVASRATAVVPLPWTEARKYVRRLVTIEGVVARAVTTPERRCVLEFDPNDPAALRVVLIIPLITDLPADPSRLYRGKRVQVTGRVTRFQDRLEMLVTPAQIEVVGLTEPTPPPPAPAAPTPPTPRATPAPPVPAASSPVPLPAAPAATPSAAPSVSTTLPPPPIVDPRCAQWREQRTALREELRALAQALEQCLAADRPGCAGLGDRLGPPLSRLADVEQRLDAACP